MREYCLYCTEQGTKTRLIRYAHWGLCPIHSRDVIAALPRPQHEYNIEVPVSLLPGRDPLLRDVGKPGWYNRIQGGIEAD